MMQHYLITLDLSGGHLHGYLMSENKRDVEPAISRIMDEAEKLGFISRAPIVLVRDILVKTFPEVALALLTAKKFNFTVFSFAIDEVNDIKLMELH